MSGNEVFYIDANGKKQDAALHALILRDGHNVKAFASTYKVLIGMGYSDEYIQKIYPKQYRALKRGVLKVAA